MFFDWGRRACLHSRQDRLFCFFFNFFFDTQTQQSNNTRTNVDARKGGGGGPGGALHGADHGGGNHLQHGPGRRLCPLSDLQEGRVAGSFLILSDQCPASFCVVLRRVGGRGKALTCCSSSRSRLEDVRPVATRRWNRLYLFFFLRIF